MADRFDPDTQRSIKMALARAAYDGNWVRVAEPDLTAYTWLVASQRGIFAVSEHKVCIVIHGWFFGICNHQNQIYLFENCGLRNWTSDMGRIVRIDVVDGIIANPTVLVTGLHAKCHHVRVIDGLLCVVDTAHQSIRRYTLKGEPVDVKHPFPVAPFTDRSGAYLHLNAIAKVGSRIAIMRHNGKALPEKNSELAWLDSDWNLLSIDQIAGHWCHDVVKDDEGVLWHCGSKAGEILSSDGRRFGVSDDMLTRGLAVAADRIIVGLSTFGPRQTRDSLGGNVAIFDRAFNRIAEMQLDGPPTDIATILV